MAYEILIYIAALIIFIYRLTKLKGRNETIIFTAMIFLSILLFSYEQASILLLLSGVIIFNGIITSYGTKKCYLFIIIALVYASLAYTIGASFMLQSLFMGMLSGSNITKEKKKSMQKGNELSRNAVQLIAGVFFIALFYFFNQNLADGILFWFIIIGSLLGNYALSRRKSDLTNFLYSFERSGTILGSGARWLAIGCLVAAAFLTRNGIIAVFAAIFIGDSFSTLFGVSFKTEKLPYNTRKSYGGSIAYFASVLIISYPLIGSIAVLVALFAALFESQPFHIDDNFDVSLAMVVLFLILGYFGFVL